MSNSTKLCRIGQPVSKSCRELPEMLTSERVRLSRTGKSSGAPPLFPSGKVQSRKLATRSVDEKTRIVQQKPMIVLEHELLEVVEGRGTEPAVDGRQGGIIVDGVATRHDEAAAGARVRREDTGDISGVDANWVAVEVEVERSGAP